MTNYLKNSLLFRLEEKVIGLEKLDAAIERPTGYSSYCICNSDIERFPEKDIEKICKTLGITEEKEHSINREIRKKGNNLSNDYILHVLDIAHDKIMKSNDDVKRLEGMLTVWSCSGDYPGAVRDVEVQSGIGCGEEYLPVEDRKETFFAYGPTYCYTLKSGMKVYFCKAIRSCYNEGLDELEVYSLYDMVLTDSTDHMIDYIELENNPIDYFNWKGNAFSKLEDIYDSQFEVNKEVPYSDKWEIREEP